MQHRVDSLYISNESGGSPLVIDGVGGGGILQVGKDGQCQVGGGFVGPSNDNMKIVRGTVAADGTIIEGTGFTCSLQTVGGVNNYSILFSKSFVDFPTVVVGTFDTGLTGVNSNSIYHANVRQCSMINCNVGLYSFNAVGGGVYNWVTATGRFYFIAVGKTT